MTSILRLASKDRSSFLFKRQSSDQAPDADNSADSLAHRLPNISHLDTRSFSELFDQFVSHDIRERPEDQQNREAGRVSHSAVDSVPTGSKEPARALDGKVDLVDTGMARNDSTASSCYSQPSCRESEYSALVTRNSSNSSYTPEPLSTLSRAVSTKVKSSMALPRPPLSVSTKTGDRKRTERAASASIMVVSSPPNLDKPLPPGPVDARKASSSVPDLLLRHTVAELPSESPISPISAFNPIHRVSSQPARMVSMRRPSIGEASPELPIWSSKSIREARVGKAVTPGHQRNRSASEAAAIEQQEQSEREKSRRHTIDVQKFASTMVAPASRPAKATRKQINGPITAATAERVIYGIMCNLHSVHDLQSTAMVSKGFLRTFQRNESKLVSHLMFKTSRPAWELRRSILALKGSKDFALKDYRRDCRTLAALKAFIVAHCGSNCKSSTLTGLLGQDNARMTQVDDALWRIWTFCTLFGNSVGQSDPSPTEIDWLSGSAAVKNKQLGAGFAIGNGKGLSTRELEDMDELWHCLQVLVSGFHGRSQEAHQFGIFDNWHLREATSETAHLAEWTSYLLARGPETVLSVSSCSFEQAKMLGLTRWPAPPAGQSRASFLTAAIAQIYQQRLLQEATQRAAQFSIPRAPVHRPTRSFDERQLRPMPSTRAATFQPHSLRLDTSSPKRRPVSTIAFASHRLDIRPDCDPISAPIDIRPDCDPASPANQRSHLFPASPTADPTAFYSLGMTPTASTKLGATLFPMDYASPTPRVPFPAAARPSAAAPGPGVVDPVDKAMSLLVQELGFGETRARKALAMCDTGSGIDLQKAIELLSVDSKDSRSDLFSPVELPTPVVSAISPSRSRKQPPPPKAYCDGRCKRTSTSTTTHSRSKSTGTATDVSVDSPVSALDEAEWQDTISPLVATPTSATRPPKAGSLSRVASKKAWKVLGIDRESSSSGGSTSKRKKPSVLGIDEYQAKVERRKSLRASTNPATAAVAQQHQHQQPPLPQVPKIREGLGKNLLGLGLGIGSSAGQKTVEDQLERARDEERRKKEKNPRLSGMVRYA